MQLQKRFGLLSFLIPVAFYVLTLNSMWSSDYQASILGLQYSIWVKHSLSLGLQANPVVHSVDVGLFNGSYYSEISPGVAFLSLPFAGLGFFLDGGTSLNVWGNAVVLDELFLAITTALAAFVVYKICRLYAEPKPSFLASMTLALCTSVWPMSTMIYIHGASLFFSVSAVYLVLRYAEEMGSDDSRYWSVSGLILAGLCLALATFVEYAAALFVFPLFIFLVLKSRQTRGTLQSDFMGNTGKGPWNKLGSVFVNTRPLLFFLASFSCGPLLQLLYNYEVFGNPLMFPEELKNAGLMGGFSLSATLQHAAFYFISPYRGLLFFSPVMILGLYGLYKMSKDEKNRSVSFLFVSLFLIVLVTYSSWTDWAGGLAYGPRFLILGLPYLAIPISVALSQNKSTKMRFSFLYLFAISSLIEGVGSLTTALSTAGNAFLYQPLALNFPWFLEGKFDTWWLSKVGATILTSQLYGIVLLQSIWFAAGYFVLKNREPKRRELEKERKEEFNEIVVPIAKLA